MSETIDFNGLMELPDETLFALGLQQWDEADEAGNVLWLFPGDWYDKIPDGLMVTNIFGEAKPFVRGRSRDQRYGSLSFGLLKHAPPTGPNEVREDGTPPEAKTGATP